MKHEAQILDSLRSAIACVYGGLAYEAARHIDDARSLLKMTVPVAGTDARVMDGLRELRDVRPTRVIEWDTSDVDVELGGEG